MRILTADEHRIIAMLAEKIGSDEERSQLLADLEGCSVKETAADGSMLTFDIARYQRPVDPGRWQYRQKDGYVVDGVVKDADGSDMDVMLLADSNRRIWEFEVVRHYPGSVIKPDWDNFKVR